MILQFPTGSKPESVEGEGPAVVGQMLLYNDSTWKVHATKSADEDEVFSIFSRARIRRIWFPPPAASPSCSRKTAPRLRRADSGRPHPETLQGRTRRERGKQLHDRTCGGQYSRSFCEGACCFLGPQILGGGTA